VAGLRRWLFTLGAAGEIPRSREGFLLCLYGLATLFYRLFVLTKILTAVLPQYLGMGLLLGVWGGYVMLVSPLLADPPPKMPSTVPRWRRIGGGIGFLALLALLLLFVRTPFVQKINLTLDDGRYLLAADGAGTVQSPVPAAMTFRAGDEILRQANPDLVRKMAVLEQERREADLIVANTRSVGAGAAGLADERQKVVVEQMAIAQQELDRLVTRAPSDGLFVASTPVRPGRYLVGGHSIGRFYPATGEAVLTGRFPENWVEFYQDTPPTAELYLMGEYLQLDPAGLELKQGTAVDPTTGLRSLTLSVKVPVSAPDLVGADLQMRLNYGRAPLWKHLAVWAGSKLTAFRDAQVSDRHSRLGAGQ
jgi:hypothetical protein